MRWYSHRRRTGGRHNCISYLLKDVLPVAWQSVAYCHAYHAHIRLLIFLHNDSVNRRILGCGDQGVWPITPKFELGRDVCSLHLIAKFHYPTFNRSEVIVLTNKQTDKLTNRRRWKHPPRNAMLRRWVMSFKISLGIKNLVVVLLISCYSRENSVTNVNHFAVSVCIRHYL